MFHSRTVSRVSATNILVQSQPEIQQHKSNAAASETDFLKMGPQIVLERIVFGSLKGKRGEALELAEIGSECGCNWLPFVC